MSRSRERDDAAEIRGSIGTARGSPLDFLYFPVGQAEKEKEERVSAASFFIQPRFAGDHYAGRSFAQNGWSLIMSVKVK